MVEAGVVEVVPIQYSASTQPAPIQSGAPVQPGAPAQPGAPVQCSAKGCRAAARWELRWNNPKLHTPDYRKTWLACDEHRRSLGDFLDARGFLREVQPFTPTSAGR